MMVGLFSLLACFVIGTIVTALERRVSDGWDVTAIATAGAISGAYIGRMLRLYVAFGELPGLVCSAVGAVVLLRIYRSQIAGMKTRDVSPPSDSEYLSAPRSEPGPPTPPRVTEPMDRAQTIPSLLAEAFGWGAMCAFATAGVGFAGHLVGSQLYPQQYEQIPSDFFFVPLGMVVGFVAAGVARLAAREWGAFAMVSFVALVSIAYAGAMFQYSRTRAVPSQITARLEPASIDAINCSPDTCNATDPPSQWYVTGRLRVKETSGLGATIDRIEITSNTDPTGPVTPHPYTKEGAAEAARGRGPLVMLTGRQIPGLGRLVQNNESTYPIVYPYHTRDGVSRRTIWISVYLTDGAGRAAYAGATWKVR